MANAGAGIVLLVEDEAAVRRFGARALRGKGYTVIEVGSGEGPLEILEKGEAIDLMITDVVMPGLDGPSLIRQARQSRPDLKVIFISGYTADSFRQRLDTDADIHFLPKPFSLQQLAGRVKRGHPRRSVLIVGRRPPLGEDFSEQNQNMLH